MKTKWDLTLLYRSPRDPRIERDIRGIERACSAFEKKYRNGTAYTKTENTLLCALCDYEKLAGKTADPKPLFYFMYRKELDSSDNEAESRLNLISDRLTKAGNRILFFELALGRIPAQKKKQFLKSKRLEHFRYFLSRIFEESKYQLTEPEEKILNLKSLPSSSLWISGFEKVLNKQTVELNGKTIPVSEAINRVPLLPTAKRRALHNAVMDRLYEISDFAESEINAVIINKKINDELRGLPKPYTATILSYENDEKSVLALVDAVTKRFDISHRFYELKRKMLKLPKLEYADRSAQIGNVKKHISFENAVSVVRSTLERIDPRYAALFQNFIAHGQIDVFPQTGKSGGAFCSGAHNLPTMVLLNHVDDLRSLTTLAHEIGHAIHTERSKTQPILYQDYSTAVAETASTFFEGMVFDAFLEKLSEKEKIVALHDKLGDTMSTVFRQIAFFNFERDLHAGIREKGSMPKKEIADLLNAHMAAYLGPAFALSVRDGYFFTAVSHFRRFFYVYSYAYGELVSNALGKRYAEDHSYAGKIDQFLSAGGSKKPEAIFGNIGIDVRNKTFFNEGLRNIERDVIRLEKLVAKTKV